MSNMSKNNESPTAQPEDANPSDKAYTVAEVMSMLGIDGYPQCKLSDFLGAIMEQARAWQLLEHLADETAPSLSIASNRIGSEIEEYRRQACLGRSKISSTQMSHDINLS